MSSIVFDFSGKTVLICGAGGGGVGIATTTALARAGAAIVGVDRTAALVDECGDKVRALGGAFHGIVADLTDATRVAEIASAAFGAANGIDLVANVAGGMQQGQWAELTQTSLELYRKVFALNLDYVFQVSRDVAKFMIERKTSGAIVNVASISGVASAPYHGPYGAAKAALVALSRTMAVEWAPHRIRVNVVIPGAVNSARATGLVERFRTFAPLGRAAEPTEIADTVLFLLCDAASGTTGQAYGVDTGLTARSVLGGLSDLNPPL